jgi:parvulin-like peptidyl-prolyl isomerase
MKATVLIQAAAVAAFAFTAFAASAAPQAVQKLPRVVVTGKATQAVAQLPRVVDRLRRRVALPRRRAVARRA